MSFGIGLGDFLKALEVANKIRTRFVDAPTQYKEISDEVRSLTIILEDVKVVLPQRDLTDEQEEELRNIAEGLHNILDTLDRTLEKYQELDSDPKGCNPESFHLKFRRGWKRLKWEPEEVMELRSRITLNISLLNAFNGRLTRQISSETKDGVDWLHKYQNDQERQAIADWFTPIDYSTQQCDFISRRQEGTGQWLLNSNEFEAWLNISKQTLFCPGIPGAGKTMITSIIVEHLFAKFQNDASVGIAYLYCNFRRQHEQNPADLLSSLLKQLVQEHRSVPEIVKSIYECNKDKRTRPSVNEISKVLSSVVIGYSRAFIIIDALDEFRDTDGGRSKLLSEIFNLQAKTGANLFITSRFIPEIMKEFEGSTSLEIRASDEDVQKYINGHISQLPSFVPHNLDLQDEIRTAITKAVDGMFLLAQLHLGSLVGKRSPKAIRVALKKLPMGSEAYDNAYKEAMERIEGQIADSQELAKQVLSWITCAKKPLTTLELRHALAVEMDEPELDQENLPEIEDIVSVCAGLVAVDEESDIIRLVHYTAQEYFERTQTYWFPNAQNYITMACITYLLFDNFKTGFCLSDKEFEARLQLNPLYDYAACNWGYHACAASTEVDISVMLFLVSDVKISSSTQAMMASRRRYPGYSLSVPRQLTATHLAAYFGLTDAMMALVRNGHDPNVKDSYGRTPLSWAAVNNQEAMVKVLLAMDGVGPDSKDKHRLTPLLLAAKNGHKALVKLLLANDGVNPESKDDLGRTPLLWAAAEGHEAVVELLIVDNRIDPDSKDNGYGQTPLAWAAWNGHEAVVKLLLAKDGVDPDPKDIKFIQTPLSWAAWIGHEGVVKLLLAKDGVDPDSEDIYGRTPLWWAAANGQEAVMKLLLAKDDVGLDSNGTEFCHMPLSWAAENGQVALVELLLAKDGADPNSKDKYGRTPLALAAKNGHKMVVELLLANGDVKPDLKDRYGRTPLSWAAASGQAAVVELLLAKDGVDPDSKGEYGETPLTWAAGGGHTAVVELLLAKGGIEPDSKDKYGETPLIWAAVRGRRAVVELLLATGAVDPDSRDSVYGQTSLSWAAEHGQVSVVELLLTTDGVDPDSQDKYGQTPLSWARVNGYDAIVELLTRIK